MIMASSLRSMMRRTNKPIRPWVQGFWYEPCEIGAQIDGIKKTLGGSWSIWSPTGRYGASYRALSQRSGIALSKPKFYPAVNELNNRIDRFTMGHSIVVNYTNYRKGYTIISLEAPKKGKRSHYAYPAAVLATLDEGIVDHILEKRSVHFNPNAAPYTKRKRLADLLCRDLDKDARGMRPEPIYINWDQACIFSTQDIPGPRLARYAAASQKENHQDVAALVVNDAINMALISETTFGVTLSTGIIQPFAVFSR